MVRVLISWIGRTDLKAAKKDKAEEEPGPVLRLLRGAERFDEIHLLNDIQPHQVTADEATPEEYRRWVVQRTGLDEDVFEIHPCEENLRNRYDLAFKFTRETVRRIRDRQRSEPARYAILLSSGYPAAQAAFIVAHQTVLGVDGTELFATSRERGVERVELPFVLNVDVVPVILREWQKTQEVPIGKAFHSIIGESRAIQLAKQQAQRVAPVDDVSVLILGETGTGKELFAKAIHEASPRAEKPFVAVNCAAIPEELLESELFGHKKGAFTDAKTDRTGKIKNADGGTVFLDEIGDMSLKLQAKLLRFLQEKEFFPVGSDEPEKADVRIVAATHRDLARTIRAGRFREDLYYRLNVVSIELPPLRERGRDVQLLAQRFLEQRDNSKRWSDEALAALLRYPWPGNVRELQHAVTRLAIFADTDEIRAEDVERWLPPPLSAPGEALGELSSDALLTHLAACLDELIRRQEQSGQPFFGLPDKNLDKQLLHPLLVGRALRATGGNAKRAGEIIRGSKLDTSSGKPDLERRELYEKYIEPHIDEDQVRRLRGLV